LQQRLLQQPVHHRRDAQQPLASVRIGYLYPPHGTRRPAPRQQFRPDLFTVASKVGFELFGGHAVDARRAAVAFDRLQRAPQILFGRHLFHQIFVHCFLSRVSLHSALGTAGRCPPRFHRFCLDLLPCLVAPTGEDLSARDSGPSWAG
jgi:hypothetical protein